MTENATQVIICYIPFAFTTKSLDNDNQLRSGCYRSFSGRKDIELTLLKNDAWPIERRLWTLSDWTPIVMIVYPFSFHRIRVVFLCLIDSYVTLISCWDNSIRLLVWLKSLWGFLVVFDLDGVKFLTCAHRLKSSSNRRDLMYQINGSDTLWAQ